MRAVVHAVALALVAIALQHCAPVEGCPAIAEKSTGACRVGLPSGWYGDDQWRTE